MVLSDCKLRIARESLHLFASNIVVNYPFVRGGQTDALQIIGGRAAARRAWACLGQSRFMGPLAFRRSQSKAVEASATVKPRESVVAITREFMIELLPRSDMAATGAYSGNVKPGTVRHRALALNP